VVAKISSSSCSCRHAAGHLPQSRELVVKIVHLLGEGVLRRALPRQQQRTVQAHAGGLSGISGVLFLLQRGALCPQPHQVVIRKAEHRPQHGRSQIDVLRRVVDDLQQRDERSDVGCFHQVFPGVGIHRDAPGRESFHIGREVPAGRKQDAAVLVLHRAGRAALPHRLPAATNSSMRRRSMLRPSPSSSSGRNCASTLPE